jgi:hypothetical protein
MKLCPCGSGEPRRELVDARGIFCTFVCDKCEDWITPTRRLVRPCCPNCGYGGAAEKVPSLQYRRFRKTVQPFFGDTCIMVPWAGMWLGIETDGYTHS